MAFMVLKYFEKLADVKPAKWRLSGGCLTIRWFIGRVLIGDKHILSGCTGYPDKRDKGTFGAGQNKMVASRPSTIISGTTACPTTKSVNQAGPSSALIWRKSSPQCEQQGSGFK